MDVALLQMSLGGELNSKVFRIATIGVGDMGSVAVEEISETDHQNFQWPMQIYDCVQSPAVQNACTESQCLLVLTDIGTEESIESACECATYFRCKNRNLYDVSICVTLEKYVGTEADNIVATAFDTVLFVEERWQLNVIAKIFNDIYCDRSIIGVSEVDLISALAQSSKIFMFQRNCPNRDVALMDADNLIAQIKTEIKKNNTYAQKLSLVTSHGWNVILSDIEDIFQAVLSGWEYNLQDACFLHAVTNTDYDDQSVTITVLVGT